MNKIQEPAGLSGWDQATLDAAVADAIRACDGDARAAVAALIIANAMLEAEFERVSARLSSGYVRGKFRLFKTSDLGREESTGE